MEEGGGIKKERGRITQYKRGTCTYNIKDSHLLVSTIIVHWYTASSLASA